jgi:hypothetical protein
MIKLVIREPQLRHLEDHAEAQFERRMLERSFEYFPQQCAFLGAPRVRQVVRFGIARATDAGYLSQIEQSYYLALVFMLGAGFETDPQFRFVPSILAGPRRAAPAARIAACYDAAMRFLDDVCGDDNEYLVRALVRVRDFDLAAFDVPDRARQADAVAGALTALYPEKAAALGGAVMRDLALSGGALASEAGLDGPRGAMLCAGLAFMLGSGFLHDPQFPWVEDALRAPARRAEMLHDGAMAYLRAALA